SRSASSTWSSACRNSLSSAPSSHGRMLVEYAELHGRFSLACNRLHNVISVLVLVKPGIVLCWQDFQSPARCALNQPLPRPAQGAPLLQPPSACALPRPPPPLPAPAPDRPYPSPPARLLSRQPPRRRRQDPARKALRQGLRGSHDAALRSADHERAGLSQHEP